MSFNATIVPENALIGNQILVQVNDISFGYDIRISIEYDGQKIFEGQGSPNLKSECIFSIGDFFASYFRETPPVNSRQVISDIAGFPIEYKVRVWDEDKETVLTGKCYPGGISRRLSRFLTENGTDIFKAKFFNYRSNFMLTTRTTGNNICMRENEIGPLYFIAKEGYSLKISDLFGHNIKITPEKNGHIYSLNMEVIRKDFFEQGSLSSYFNITVNNKTVLTVSIIKGAENPVVLMFKNSYGVYEKIELAGKVNVQPEFTKQNPIDVFDNAIYEFTQKVERNGYTPAVTVESGYKTIEELNFIRDMLISEDVYLINGQERIRVMVSTTKMKYKEPQSEPISVEIKITFCDRESYSFSMLNTLPAYLINKEETLITSQERKIILNKPVK